MTSFLQLAVLWQASIFLLVKIETKYKNSRSAKEGKSPFLLKEKRAPKAIIGSSCASLCSTIQHENTYAEKWQE